jgi:hypothetical protein
LASNTFALQPHKFKDEYHRSVEGERFNSVRGSSRRIGFSGFEETVKTMDKINQSEKEKLSIALVIIAYFYVFVFLL